MTLQDKVAFACMYLDDNQLCNYVYQQMADVVQKGYILGLFLTGLSASGIKLLTNFVNEVGGHTIFFLGVYLIQSVL